MIKARTTDCKGDTVFIGLERANIDRLLAGQPILFDGTEIGLRGVKFCVLAGETQEDILDDLRSIGVIGPVPK